MPRPKKAEKDKKIMIPITLDKNIYFYLKNNGFKVSTYINQMLKVALDTGFRANDNNSENLDSTLVRLRSRVQFPPEAKVNFFKKLLT